MFQLTAFYKTRLQTFLQVSFDLLVRLYAIFVRQYDVVNNVNFVHTTNEKNTLNT